MPPEKSSANDRLSHSLEEGCSRTAEQATDLILGTVSAWSSSQSDDRTIIVCDYKPKPTIRSRGAGLDKESGGPAPVKQPERGFELYVLWFPLCRFHLADNVSGILRIRGRHIVHKFLEFHLSGSRYPFPVATAGPRAAIDAREACLAAPRLRAEPRAQGHCCHAHRRPQDRPEQSFCRISQISVGRKCSERPGSYATRKLK